jgi:hypothetical protein
MRIRKRSRSRPWTIALGWVLLAAILLIPFAGRADHTVGALLERVKKTGFYRIILPPQLVARCREDLADLRICRPDGVFIPYVLNDAAGSPWIAGALPLPDPQIRQRDSSDKHSYISLEFGDAYRIDRLSLVVRGPSLYKRRARIMEGTRSIAVITIDPHDSVFRIPAVKARRLLIDIENADNAPLVISRVASFQSGIYVLAHLEDGNEYELEGGDSLAERPDYDLHYFTDSLRRRPMDIGFQSVYLKEYHPPMPERDSSRRDSDAAASRAAVASRKGSIRSTVVLWSVLALVLLFLLYFSAKMVRAIGKKESNDRL